MLDKEVYYRIEKLLAEIQSELMKTNTRMYWKLPGTIKYMPMMHFI